MTRLADDPTMPADDARRLRDALADAGYTLDGVRALLGPVGWAALSRNETTPAARSTALDGSPLATLTRLWPLQRPVPTTAAHAALGDAYAALLTGGFLVPDGEDTAAVVDVRPYGTEDHDWWVASDPVPGLDGRFAPSRVDHVLGPNPASSTLAQLTVRRPVGSALDLGTGCGVEALHLAGHAQRVVGTDLNPRALALARVTADLNGIAVDLREGDLYAPVAGELFDLVVSNPPFVVGPGTDGRTYRDAGLPGDELSRRVVVDGAARLAEGGVLQTLATWLHVDGEDWQERVAGWVDGLGCDAWVVQREVQDPAEHAEVWLRDSGEVSTPGYPHRYEAWLDWFDALGATGVGFGWVVLRRTAAADPDVQVEEWPHPVAQPLGPDVAKHLDAVEALRGLSTDEALLAARLRVAADVVQETLGQPGAEDPEQVVLRRGTGMRRARAVGTAEAALVGACDGELPVGALVDAIASVLDVGTAELRAELLPRLRGLVTDGYLEPAA